MKKSGKCKVLPPKAEKALQLEGEEITVVFAMDRKGNIRAYRSGKNCCEPVETRCPVRAEEITSMRSLAIFQTSNPKVCFTDPVSGNLICVPMS